MRVKLSYKELFKLWFKSLFYHASFSRDYIMDTLVEPLFWIVDHFVVILGRFFVALVGILVGSIIILSHLIGIPVYWPYSPTITVCMFGIGYWIILNLTFNFVQGVRVSPGVPSDLNKITSSVTICKKCISPKPARTHHCSICNRCYLNMDHHCPWMNNCVGHFNRRYFYLTMVYIVTGCLYVMILGLSLAYRQVIQGDDVLPFKDFPKEISNHAQMGSTIDLALPPAIHDALSHTNLGNVLALGSRVASAGVDTVQVNSTDNSFSTEQAELLFGIRITRTVLLVLLYYAAAVTIGASLALGGLIIWHGKLIQRGETSIEYHINKAERQRIGAEFVNPYDLGWRKNWELFFGLDQKGRKFWRCVLFPSTHRPTGNGYNWSYITDQTVGSFDSFKRL